MSSREKKEIFLSTLNSLFGDNTGEIDGENCVAFYHFLIDSLEKEEPVEYDDVILYREVINFLCNFDIMFIDFRVTNTIAKDRKKILQFFSETTGLSEFELLNSLAGFRKIYIFIKDGFLLSSY